MLCFYKIAPYFNVEMSKLSMVLYLCLIICVWLSFLMYNIYARSDVRIMDITKKGEI